MKWGGHKGQIPSTMLRRSAFSTVSPHRGPFTPTIRNWKLTSATARPADYTSESDRSQSGPNGTLTITCASSTESTTLPVLQWVSSTRADRTPLGSSSTRSWRPQPTGPPTVADRPLHRLPGTRSRQSGVHSVRPGPHLVEGRRSCTPASRSHASAVLVGHRHIDRRIAWDQKGTMAALSKQTVPLVLSSDIVRKELAGLDPTTAVLPISEAGSTHAASPPTPTQSSLGERMSTLEWADR